MAISTAERKQRSSIGPVVIGAFCLLALLGVSASYYFKSPSGNEKETKAEVAQASSKQTPLESEDPGDPLEDEGPAEKNTSRAGRTAEAPTAAANEEEPEQTLTQPDAAFADESDGGPGMTDDSATALEIGSPDDPQRPSPMEVETEAPTPPEPEPDRVEDEAPSPKEASRTDQMDAPEAQPDPSQPEDPPAEPTNDEATPTSLGPLLKATRENLRNQDYDAADAKLAKADGMATSEEHKAMVSRLRLIAKYARQFHDAMHSGFKNLKANSEIEVGTGDTINVVYVVEIRDDGVVFRVNGVNKRYDGLDKVPFGLAVAIGTQSLGMDGPRTALRRGAFVATVSDPNDEEAIPKVRIWWESAAKYVDDAKVLLAALDDSYDF